MGRRGPVVNDHGTCLNLLGEEDLREGQAAGGGEQPPQEGAPSVAGARLSKSIYFDAHSLRSGMPDHVLDDRGWLGTVIDFASRSQRQ